MCDGTDGEIDYQAVATRVAEVTLESDSLPETPSSQRVRRKKRPQRRQKQMEIDPPQPSTSGAQREQRPEAGIRMDWEGESDVCSSNSNSSCDRDADDEQSDWVGYGVLDNDDLSTEAILAERRRRMKPPTAMSTIQRKLERFSKDPAAVELTVDIRIKERTNSLQFNRLLQLYKLEVLRRHRGTVVLKKKNKCPQTVEEKIDEN